MIMAKKQIDGRSLIRKTGVQHLIKRHAPLLHVLPQNWRQKCTITNMLLKSSNVTGERN